MKTIRSIFRFNPPWWHVWNPLNGWIAGSICALPLWPMVAMGLQNAAMAYMAFLVAWLVFALGSFAAMILENQSRCRYCKIKGHVLDDCPELKELDDLLK